MKLPPALILLALLFFPGHLRALALTSEPLDTSYVKPRPGLFEKIGETPLAIGGGFLTGLILFGFWKGRRDRRAVGSALLFLIFFGTSRPAAGCVNVEQSTLENSYTKYLDTLDWFSKPVERALAARPEDDPHVTPNPAAYPREPPAGIRENDAAVRMILKGNASGALEMLKQIETDHPGLYATAANLGTCYELTGDDEQALHWIQEGLQRNPYSHMLAEWLHVRVLKAKIALKSDPAWLSSHTITGLDPSEGTFYTDQGVKNTEAVLASFRSQCTVRALFIKPRDPVMAQLLYEAATFMLDEHANSIESTLALARQYGLSEERAAALQAKAEAVLKSGSAVGRPSSFVVWLHRWKSPFFFLNALLLGLLIPMAYVLKKENGSHRA